MYRRPVWAGYVDAYYKPAQLLITEEAKDDILLVGFEKLEASLSKSMIIELKCIKL